MDLKCLVFMWKIVQVGIELMDQLGYEAFTFKKLGVEINSNESPNSVFFIIFECFILLCSESACQVSSTALSRGFGSGAERK